MKMNTILAFLILSLAVGAAFTSGITNTECNFLAKIPDKTGLKCGYLEVPENHDKPDGKKIKIAYAVIKTTSATPAMDPMIFFSGGPGGSSLGAGFIGFMKTSPIGKKRDIILFDQRGINNSSALPDIGKGVFDAMAADTDIAGEGKLIAKTLDEYKKKAESGNIDLENYNTNQNARDVGALMDTLGYKKYNLFGVSYGTRLARTIQDLFPDKIRTVTLDSPNLMTDDFLIDRMRSYSAAADKVIKFCAGDSECRKAFPNLEKDYNDVVKKLEKKAMPVEYDGSVFYVNSQDAVYFLRRQLYSNNAKKLFPEFVMALKSGNKKVIRTAIVREKGDVTNGSFNSSMFLAVSVFESMDKRNTPKKIDAMYQKLPYFPAQLGFFTNLYIEGMRWHGRMLPINERKFKISTVPTMIFVNQYDPVTPPENGPLFQKKLTKSHLYILDVGGHSGGDFPCKMRVMEQFMDDPDAAPDGSCLKLYK